MTARFKVNQIVGFDQLVATNPKFKPSKKRSYVHNNHSFTRGFNHLVCKMTFPEGTSATALVYKSGRINLLGAKDFSTLMDAVFFLIAELDVDIEEDLTISNLVMSASFEKKINLTKLFNKLRDNELGDVSYETELFPALIFKPKNSLNGKTLIFHTGKVIITGLKQENDGNSFFEYIKPFINENLY